MKSVSWKCEKIRRDIRPLTYGTTAIFSLSYNQYVNFRYTIVILYFYTLGRYFLNIVI